MPGPVQLALLRAQQRLIEPAFRPYEGQDPLGYVLAANLARRHLDESQRAMIAASLAKLKQGRQNGKGANLHLSPTSEGAAG
jgi:hypothetical protein